MEWWLSDWKACSVVEIVLQDTQEDECDVLLSQSGIPVGEKKEKIQFGWKEYYFTAMSKLCGYPQKD